MTLKERAKNLKENIPAVYIALKSEGTPVIAKIVAAVTVIYALSPIDLIPDFIPLLGYLDDIILLPAMIALTITLIPDNVWAESREKALKCKETGKGRWYYAIPVIIIWTVLLALIIKIIFF